MLCFSVSVRAAVGPVAVSSRRSSGGVTHGLQELCMVASPLCLSRSGVWRPDLKSFPHKHHPGWGGAAGAVCLEAQPGSDNVSRRAGCLGSGPEAESTPLAVLGNSLLFSQQWGLRPKAIPSSVAPPEMAGSSGDTIPEAAVIVIHSSHLPRLEDRRKMEPYRAAPTGLGRRGESKRGRGGVFRRRGP